MAVELTNVLGEDYSLSNSVWSLVLNLAQRYGWKPLGTLRPAELDESTTWGGDYDTSDGQTVTSADAAALSRALRAAIADPHLEIGVRKVVAALAEVVRAQLGDDTAKLYASSVPTSDDLGPILGDLRDFFDQGEFVIE